MRDKVKRTGGGGRNHATTDAAPLTNGKGVVGTKQEDDVSFPVRIQGAGVEPFEMQVNGLWLVQDVIIALLARNEVCPHSSLALSLSGMTLDPLAELQTLKGLKPGSVLRLVEEPYTTRTARVHLGRVLDLLRTSGPQDALREGRSPSVLDTLTHTPNPDPSPANGKSLKRSSSNTKTEPTNQDGAVPEYLLPGSLERPLMALLPQSSQPEAPSYLRDLSLSCWNPPPGHRKLQGDFLYITVVSLEGRHFEITSSPRGFYLNRSTEELFDPRPAQPSSVFHCLTDLLSHISPLFKQGLASLRTRAQRPAAEMVPTPYRTPSWLGPTCAARAHKNTFSRLGLDEQASAQGPDWNEEMQAARDLSQGSLEERLHRDRALTQVNSAFVWAVAQGAESVMDGLLEPINGNLEDPAFLWGGLFMSQGPADTTHGGERGRRAVQRLELRGVQAYSNLEGALQGLHTLPTAIVDYRGVRLSAQGLAPGLEGSEPDQENHSSPRGLLYGVNAVRQESPNRRRLLELLAQAAKALSLQRHSVVAPNGYNVPLFTSVDAQGLLGADSRYYLLDLYRSFPADANFCPEAQEEGDRDHGEEEEESRGAEEGWPEDYHSHSGLPKNFPHGLCRLRPELVQAFAKHKHHLFNQCVKEKMALEGILHESGEAGDQQKVTAIREACKAVGSVSDFIFEMRLNPNIFSPGVSFPKSDSESTRLQRRLLREAASSIVTHQIPAFVEYCLQGTEAPMDGASLKQALHQRGINLRYLGHVTKAICESEHRERLRHTMRLVIGEITVRSARRVFNGFLQGIDVSSLSAAVSHFLCCLLVPHFSPSLVGEETKKKSRRRGRGGGVSESTPWSMLTGAELWNLIGQDAAETYGITDSLGSDVTHLVGVYGVQKLSLLREFCLKTGVQLRMRDYLLDGQSKAPIGPDDVVNIFPVVKHIHMPVNDASKSFHAAQTAIQKGLLDQAHERLKEAVYLYGRVCDELHPDACRCLSLLACVAYLQGQAAEARSVQLKAVVISERVFGFDHPNTIQQYVNFAVYVFAGGENVLAQKCLLRARHLMLTVHGEDHPFMAIIDNCLGLIVGGDKAGLFLQNALRLNSSFFSTLDLRTALNQHLVSQWLCSKGDYRSAMSHEKEAFTAFTAMFGENHPQSRCSSEFLRSITQKAVQVERSLRQSESEQAEPHSPECVSPSTETVLEQLVLITGIRKTADSDKLREFKHKLIQQRVAELVDLATKATEERAALSMPSKGEGRNEKEKNAEKTSPDSPDQSSPLEDNSENQKEQLQADAVNSHVEQPREQNSEEKAGTETEGGDEENTDIPAPEAEELSGQVNGEELVKPTQEETESNKATEEEGGTQNGGLESDESISEVESRSDKGNEDMSPNGLEILTDQSECQDMNADVVPSKASLLKLEGAIEINGTIEEGITVAETEETAIISNGKTETDITPNGVANGAVVANGTAEE